MRIGGAIVLAGLGIALARSLYVHGGPPGLSGRAQLIILGIACVIGLGGRAAGKNEQVRRLALAVRYP